MGPEQMNGSEPEVTEGAQAEQAVAYAEPKDLNSAFLSLRQAGEPMVENPVDDGQEVQPELEPDESGSDIGGEDPVGLGEDDAVDAGGYADGFDGIAVEAAQRDLIKSVNEQATRYANQYFEEQGIRKFGMSDLYRRDEQSGRVTFENPDDPSRPFQSRAEAQQWIDAVNSEIDREWQRVARDAQQRYAEDAAPAARMLAFAKTYDEMSADEQDIFDELIAPYEVKSNGKVVGYSCDLNRAHEQAVRIAGRYAARNTAAGDEGQDRKEPSGPAMDMKSTGSEEQTAGKPEEPANLAEALAMYQKQKRQQQGV